MRLVRFVKPYGSDGGVEDCSVNPDQVVALTKSYGSDLLTVIWFPSGDDSLTVVGSLDEVAALLLGLEVPA